MTKMYDRDLENLALFFNQFLAYNTQVNSAFGVCWLASSEVIKVLLERFSFAFTANGKRQAGACLKSKKIILF